MSRLSARIRYYAVEAWEEFGHSPGPNLLAAAVLAGSLFVAAAILLVQANVARTLEDWDSQLRVDVFLMDGAAVDEVASLRSRLEAVAGVARVEQVDKAEALRRFRAAFGSLGAVAEEMQENPLPESLQVTLEPGSASDAAPAVMLAADGDPVVEDTRWDRPIVERIEAALRFVRLGGGALGALVFGALTLVMAGVLRLAVLARRDEIEIMRLVGAGPAMVRGPFLLAGAVQGVFGGVVALASLEAARRMALARAAEIGPLADAGLGSPLPPLLASSIVVAGLAVGTTGAWFAVGAYGRPPQPQKSKTM